MPPSDDRPDNRIELRWGSRLTFLSLAAWALIVLLFTLGPFRWHLDYFAKLGPEYRVAIAAVLIALGVVAGLYAWLRGRGIWRWELRLLAAGTLAAVFVDSPLSASVCCLLFAAAFSIGAEILDRLGVKIPSALAKIPLAAAAGLGVLILALIPLGVAGLYDPITFAVLLAAPLVALRRRVVELGPLIIELDRNWRETQELRSPLVGVAVAFTPAYAAAFLMSALAPAIAYDGVSHHLPAARHYLMSGSLEPLPLVEGAFRDRLLFSLGHSVAYSYYPQSFEELLTLAIGLGGQTAAQLVTPLFFVLTLMAAAALGRLWGCSRLGCVIGLFGAAALPFAHWTGSIVKNDYALAFFLLAALYCVLRAADGPTEWLVLAAAFLGLSFGVKHVALFGAIPIGVLMLNLVRKRARPLLLAAVLACVFAVSGLFWHVRTYALTGSPIFPAGVKTATHAYPALDGTRPSRWAAHFLYPWTAHFDGHKVLESPTANPLGFYFVVFASCWALTRRAKLSRIDWSILVFLGLYYLYWVYIWGVLRYAIAPILILAILTGERVAAVAACGGAEARRTAAAAFGYCFAFGLMPTLMLEVNAYQFPYFARRLDKPGYLRATMTDYRSLEFINQTAEPEDRVLSINNCAAAYAYDPARFRCVRMLGASSDGKFQLIKRTVESMRPDYLLLPNYIAREEMLSILRGAGYADSIYKDDRYLILLAGR